MMNGKKGIIFGVANQRSIAWGIAREMLENGAEVAFTYMAERLRPTLEKLVSQYPNKIKLYECDATDEAQLEKVAAEYKEDFGQCDFLVHSIAYADKDSFAGHFYKTNKDVFMQAIDVSAYTLVSMTRAFESMMVEGSSIIALSYLGGVKVIQNYNMMGVAKSVLESCMRYLAHDLGPRGIRVNAISAGPVNTLAARGIPGFIQMLRAHRKIAPLRANTTADQVGKAGLYLLSDMGAGVSAEVLYVDGGYAQIGLGPMEAYNLED